MNVTACREPWRTPLSAYVLGCRCDRCAPVGRAYYRERARHRPPRPPAYGPPRPHRPPPPRPRVPTVDRVMARTVPGPGGCLLFNGATGAKGYGVVKDPDRGVLGTHVVTWEAANGRRVPAGLQLDHLCTVRRCVNPAHLEPVTPAENDRRARARRAARR